VYVKLYPRGAQAYNGVWGGVPSGVHGQSFWSEEVSY